MIWISLMVMGWVLFIVVNYNILRTAFRRSQNTFWQNRGSWTFIRPKALFYSLFGPLFFVFLIILTIVKEFEDD